MPHYDQKNARCRVYVQRDGVLSVVGHDLEIAVDRFDIEARLDADGLAAVEARFAADSLRIIDAVDARREPTGELSARDRRKIAHNMEAKVLHPDRYPDIRFASTMVEPTARGWRVAGQLTLHGMMRSIRFEVQRDSASWRSEIRLHQPDFGIQPYTAMMGALRVDPDVCVVVEVPAPNAE